MYTAAERFKGRTRRTIDAAGASVNKNMDKDIRVFNLKNHIICGCD